MGKQEAGLARHSKADESNCAQLSDAVLNCITTANFSGNDPREACRALYEEYKQCKKLEQQYKRQRRFETEREQVNNRWSTRAPNSSGTKADQA